MGLMSLIGLIGPIGPISHLWPPINQLGGHEVGLFTLVAVTTDEIGEKEDFEYQEDDYQLDNDNSPQRLSQLHIAKAVIVKVEDPVPEAVLCHRPIVCVQR